jgi:hypothetical protein
MAHSFNELVIIVDRRRSIVDADIGQVKRDRAALIEIKQRSPQRGSAIRLMGDRRSPRWVKRAANGRWSLLNAQKTARELIG